MSLSVALPVPSPSSSRLVARRVTLPNRGTFEYVDRGDGPAVIFLHGLTDSWRSFEELSKRFPRDLRFLALSQRGHGESAKPDANYRMEDFAEDVIAFMDALGIEKAMVVGHSMGSVVAQNVAALYPTRVERLVLIGSATTFDTPGVREFAASLDELRDPIARELAVEFQTSTLKAPIADTLLETVVNESLKVPARVWRAALQGLLGHLGQSRVRAIQAPTLIVWGAYDAYCTREEQVLLVSMIAGSKLVAYEDLGHTPQWEDPDRLARDLIPFLRG